MESDALEKIKKFDYIKTFFMVSKTFLTIKVVILKK